MLRKLQMSSQSFDGHDRDIFICYEVAINELERRLNIPSVVEDANDSYFLPCTRPPTKVQIALTRNYLRLEYIRMLSFLSATLAWTRKKHYVKVVSAYPGDSIIFVEYSDGEFRMLDWNTCEEPPELTPETWENFPLVVPDDNTIKWPGGQKLPAEYLYTRSRGI